MIAHLHDLDPILASSYVAKATTLAVQKPLPWKFANTINGKQIELITNKRKNVQLRHGFRWEDQTGKIYEIHDLFMPSKGLIPEHEGETRTIHLVPEGIDVRDADAKPVGTNPPLKTVTAPLSVLNETLQLHEHRDAFFALWEHVTGCKAKDRLFPSTLEVASRKSAPDMVYPKSFFASSRQEPLLWIKERNQATMDQLNALKPLQCGDFMWLFNQFMLWAYPKGGSVFATSPVFWPDLVSIWSKITEFCLVTEFQMHPHLDSLRTLAENRRLAAVERGYAAVSLRSALEVVRVVKDVKTLKTTGDNPDTGDSANVQGNEYQIGSEIAENLLDPDEVLPELVSAELADDEPNASASMPIKHDRGEDDPEERTSKKQKIADDGTEESMDVR